MKRIPFLFAGIAAGVAFAVAIGMPIPRTDLLPIHSHTSDGHSALTDGRPLAACAVHLVVDESRLDEQVVGELREAAKRMTKLTGMPYTVGVGSKRDALNVPVQFMAYAQTTEEVGWEGVLAFVSNTDYMYDSVAYRSVTRLVVNEDLLPLMPRTGKGSQRSTLLHELAHIAGLEHNETDRNALMAPMNYTAEFFSDDELVLLSQSAKQCLDRE